MPAMMTTGKVRANSSHSFMRSFLPIAIGMGVMLLLSIAVRSAISATPAIPNLTPKPTVSAYSEAIFASPDVPNPPPAILQNTTCLSINVVDLVTKGGGDPSLLHQGTSSNVWEYNAPAHPIKGMVLPPRMTASSPNMPFLLPEAPVKDVTKVTFVCLAPAPNVNDARVIPQLRTTEDGIKALSGEWSQIGHNSLHREKGPEVSFIVPSETLVAVSDHTRAYLPGDPVQATTFFVTYYPQPSP